MDTVAIFPNSEKADSYKIVNHVISLLEQKGIRVLLPLSQSRLYGVEKYGVDSIESIPADMALTIGGDGTLLGVCRRYQEKSIPVCGINIGTLGFLADIEPGEIDNKIDKILCGDYRVESRIVLSAYAASGKVSKFLGQAINDIVVTKKGVARMVHLGLDINGTHLSDFKADGIIISTPTGSTAYSLSAGGPIMNPTVSALLVTPICAHSFYMRPLVIASDDIVHIEVSSHHQETILTFDGQDTLPLHPGDSIVIKKAPFQAKIIKFNDKDYYGTVKNKLWQNH